MTISFSREIAILKILMKQLSHILLLLQLVFLFCTDTMGREQPPSAHAGGSIAAFRECRFLSLRSDHQEKRLEMTSLRREMLFSLLQNTNIGQLVIAELNQFIDMGIGNDKERKLHHGYLPFYTLDAYDILNSLFVSQMPPYI